ncbi:hypothetical protein OG21DRAFT_1002538 [Imleria badia]|nr:hypothetical protein OG21DRAFT_1002538 [Imleria badia]
MLGFLGANQHASMISWAMRVSTPTTDDENAFDQLTHRTPLDTPLCTSTPHRSSTARYEYHIGTPTSSKASDSDPFKFVALALKAKHVLPATTVQSPHPPLRPSAPPHSPDQQQGHRGVVRRRARRGAVACPCTSGTLIADERPPTVGRHWCVTHLPRLPAHTTRAQASCVFDLAARRGRHRHPLEHPPSRSRCMLHRAIPPCPNSPAHKRGLQQWPDHLRYNSRTKRVKTSYQHIPTPSSTRSVRSSSRQSIAPPTPVLPRRSTRKAAVGARIKLRGTSTTSDAEDGGRMKLRSRSKANLETKLTTRVRQPASKSKNVDKDHDHGENGTGSAQGQAERKRYQGQGKGASVGKRAGLVG